MIVSLEKPSSREVALGVKKQYITFGLFALVLLGAYFINVEVQTYLGEKALSESGLEIYSLDKAFAMAEAENKMVLADLSAIWCPSCRTLDKKVLSNEAVQADISARFIFARIEYESEQGEAFMKRYQVSGFPNLLVLDAAGNKIKQLPVVFDPEEFRRNL